jgi:hypothetical protein
MIVQVVVVVNIVDVRDSRVRDVHVIEVAAAYAIPGNERLAESQRTPAKASAKTKAEVHAPSRSAKPRDQRGSIVRTLPDRSRSPAPVTAAIDPTAIVEWSVAPRLSFNPGPSPRVFPNPIAVVIR